MSADDNNSPSNSPAKEGNGLGIAGFVVALVGAVLFWVPVLGIILSVIGVVFSAIGIRAARKFDAPHKGLSIAGLVVGLVALLVSIIFTIVVLVVVDTVIDCLDHYDDYLRAPIGSEAEAEAYDRWLECDDG